MTDYLNPANIGSADTGKVTIINGQAACPKCQTYVIQGERKVHASAGGVVWAFLFLLGTVAALVLLSPLAAGLFFVVGLLVAWLRPKSTQPTLHCPGCGWETDQL